MEGSDKHVQRALGTLWITGQQTGKDLFGIQKDLYHMTWRQHSDHNGMARQHIQNENNCIFFFYCGTLTSTIES